MKTKTENYNMRFEKFLLVCAYILAASIAAAFIMTALGGCSTTKQLAENLGQKNMLGDGFLAISKITVTDPEAGDLTPMIKTIIVNGRVQTVLKDANLLVYDRKSSGAWYNAKNVTTVESMTISLSPGGNMADTLRRVNEYMTAREQAAANAETEKKTE